MAKPVFKAFPLHFKHDDGYFDGDKGFTFFIYLHFKFHWLSQRRKIAEADKRTDFFPPINVLLQP